jgi:hypothetical protein
MDAKDALKTMSNFVFRNAHGLHLSQFWESWESLKNEIESLKAENAELRARLEWQPMETAPSKPDDDRQVLWRFAEPSDLFGKFFYGSVIETQFLAGTRRELFDGWKEVE